MNKPFITVWYITAKEPDYLYWSTRTMNEYKWVDKIIILHTNRVPPDNKRDSFINKFDHPKIKQCWSYFGQGFVKSIGRGGFDEVEARNMAIDIAEKNSPPGSWLLQCDSDEFYSEDFGSIIYDVDKKGKDGINVNCNHLINNKEIGFLPGCPDDPHIRAFKAGLGVRYVINPNAEFLDKYPNKSVHCVLNNKIKSLININGLYHFHARNLIGKKKKRENEYNPQLKKKKIDYTLPELYQKQWEKENAKK